MIWANVQFFLFLLFFVLNVIEDRLYRKQLLDKAKRQETEFINKVPVVLMLEEDYHELKGGNKHD